MKKVNKNKVLIGMTGGVDSTVAAFLLKKQGMECIGVSLVLMDTKKDSDYYGLLNGCKIEDLDKVKSICDFLDIPFYAVNAQSFFQYLVMDPVVACCLEGKDFTPCISCNRVKLQILMEKAKLLGADKICTGHYAKIHFDQVSKKYLIYSANDLANDQSSLLSGLTQPMLKKLILPMGDTRREEVRKLAEKFSFPCLDRPDRGKICFYGKPEFSNFIRSKSDEHFLEEGPITHFELETQLGEHQGIHLFRIGDENIQGEGINLYHPDKNLSVVKIDPINKEVFLGPKDHIEGQEFFINDFTPLCEVDYSQAYRLFIKFPFAKELLTVRLYFKNNNCATIHLTQKVGHVLVGQDFTLFRQQGVSARLFGRGKIKKIFKEITMKLKTESVEEVITDDDGEVVPHIGKEFEL